MKLTPRNPTDGIYPATEDYVHAMEVEGARRLLFVSGTIRSWFHRGIFTQRCTRPR